jgi:hypothetical protein
METLDTSPMPSSSRNTGSKASGAVLRSNSISGLRALPRRWYQPMASPSGMANTMASSKPPSERARLMEVCSHSWPFSASAQPAASTSLSGGRKVGSVRPRRGASSHSRASATIRPERQVALASWW